MGIRPSLVSTSFIQHVFPQQSNIVQAGGGGFAYAEPQHLAMETRSHSKPASFNPKDFHFEVSKVQVPVKAPNPKAIILANPQNLSPRSSHRNLFTAIKQSPGEILAPSGYFYSGKVFKLRGAHLGDIFKLGNTKFRNQAKIIACLYSYLPVQDIRLLERIFRVSQRFISQSPPLVDFFTRGRVSEVVFC